MKSKTLLFSPKLVCIGVLLHSASFAAPVVVQKGSTAQYIYIPKQPSGSGGSGGSGTNDDPLAAKQFCEKIYKQDASFTVDTTYMLETSIKVGAQVLGGGGGATLSGWGPIYEYDYGTGNYVVNYWRAASGGGGGSSAVVVNSVPVVIAAGGAAGPTGQRGAFAQNALVMTVTKASPPNVKIYVGGGGGSGAWAQNLPNPYYSLPQYGARAGYGAAGWYGGGGGALIQVNSSSQPGGAPVFATQAQGGGASSGGAGSVVGGGYSGWSGNPGASAAGGVPGLGNSSLYSAWLANGPYLGFGFGVGEGIPFIASSIGQYTVGYSYDDSYNSYYGPQNRTVGANAAMPLNGTYMIKTNIENSAYSGSTLLTGSNWVNNLGGGGYAAGGTPYIYSGGAGGVRIYYSAAQCNLF